MSKKTVYKDPVYSRFGIPTVSKDKDGNALLLCPFCRPPHPLLPNQAAICGTRLEVRAIQPVIRAKYDKKILCAKCGQGGSEMVQYGSAFIHTNDCTPGVGMMTEAPKFSKLAEWVHGLPEGLRATIEKRTGTASPVEEMTPDGKKTGKTLGYIFYKST